MNLATYSWKIYDTGLVSAFQENGPRLGGAVAL